MIATRKPRKSRLWFEYRTTDGLRCGAADQLSSFIRRVAGTGRTKLLPLSATQDDADKAFGLVQP